MIKMKFEQHQFCTTLNLAKIDFLLFVQIATFLAIHSLFNIIGPSVILLRG